LKKRIILVIFLILLIGVGSLVYFGQRETKQNNAYYSGTIETTDSALSFQISGKISTVSADEGASVQEGQILAEVDRAEYLARRAQSTANLKAAEQNIDTLGSILDMLRETLPADVARAEAGVESAQAVAVEAKKNKERFDNLFAESVVSESEWEAATLRYATAKAKFAEAEAVLRQARSNGKKIETTEKEIEAARAQLLAVRAALDFAEIQLGHTRLTAPFAGIITDRSIEPGEVVTPGREVLTLSDISRVELKIYVGETDIGKVTLGQPCDVKIDSFPDRSYPGKVSFVSPEGEFTPKIIQTHKERVKLVYLVKISISNPDGELKSGMPADAWLR
jgi:HlyD family secretion protein